MQFTMKILVIIIMMLVAVLLVSYMASSLIGEEYNILGQFIDYFNGVISGFSGGDFEVFK